MATALLAEPQQQTAVDAPYLVSIDSSGIRMTPEEFDALDEELWDPDYHYELVHGVLIVVPPVSEGERGPNDLLGHLLWYYQKFHAEGHVVDKTLPENLIKTDDSRRRCDRVVWVGLGRTPKAREDVPTIAIEMVSSGKRSFERDYQEKRDEYLARRVKEYWIIDRFRRQMTVIRAADGDTEEVLIAEADVYATPLLPGFELPLKQLLNEADELESA